MTKSLFNLGQGAPTTIIIISSVYFSSSFSLLLGKSKRHFLIVKIIKAILSL
jgi:hypothetical protein